MILTGVLEGDKLARAQRAWNEVMEPQWAEWEAEQQEADRMQIEALEWTGGGRRGERM